MNPFSSIRHLKSTDALERDILVIYYSILVNYVPE